MRARSGNRQLTEPVVIQARSGPLSDFSDPPEWETYTTSIASIEPLTPKELVIAQQQDSHQTHRIYLRHVPGITAAMRIVDSINNRVFNIVGSPVESERRQWYRIEAIEDVSDYG